MDKKCRGVMEDRVVLTPTVWAAYNKIFVQKGGFHFLSRSEESSVNFAFLFVQLGSMLQKYFTLPGVCYKSWLRHNLF